MLFLAYLYILLNIDYRGLQEFLRGLSKFVSFSLVSRIIPTTCRRVNRLSLPLKETLIQYEGKEVIISLDSTGMKVTNRGEWMKQKLKVRRGWIKVHICVDDQCKQVVGIAVTDEKVHDSKEFENLVNQSRENVSVKWGKVVQANGDSAYDSNII